MSIFNPDFFLGQSNPKIFLSLLLHAEISWSKSCLLDKLVISTILTDHKKLGTNLIYGILRRTNQIYEEWCYDSTSIVIIKGEHLHLYPYVNPTCSTGSSIIHHLRPELGLGSDRLRQKELVIGTTMIMTTVMIITGT